MRARRGDRVVKLAVIVLLRGLRERDRRPGLHDAALTDDDGPLADLPHNGEVMADEQVAHGRGLADVRQQIEYLGLDGNVQGGYCFIQDEDLRLCGKSPGNGHPLALAAGQRCWEDTEFPSVHLDAVR